MARFMGVDTNDPDIVNVIRNMTDRGAETGEIVKVVGMPYEVCDSHRQQRLRQTQKVRISVEQDDGPAPETTMEAHQAERSTEESRLKTSERMKKFWADKRQKRAEEGGS